MLKKFLSILGSITITTSSATIVSSCNEENFKKIPNLKEKDSSFGKEGFIWLFMAYQEKGIKIYFPSGLENEVIRLQYFNPINPNNKVNFINFKKNKVNISINDDFGLKGHQNWIWGFNLFDDFYNFFVIPHRYNKYDNKESNKIYKGLNITIRANKNKNYFYIFLVKYIYNDNNILLKAEKIGKVKIEL